MARPLQTVTHDQFEAVRPMLENLRKATRPRRHDLYDVFAAMLHRYGTRCSWRKLPPGSPPWRTVNEYHNIWTAPREGGAVLWRAFDQLGITYTKERI